MQYILSVDIGGTTCKCAIFTTQLKLVKHFQINTDTSQEGIHIIPNIKKAFDKELLALEISITDCAMIGVGVPGPVKFDTGVMDGGINLNWNGHVHVKEKFENTFKLPAIVDNDANVATLGEQFFGSGKNEKDVAMLTLGTGVGGGLVIDHKLVHGNNGAAAEFGHIFVDHKYKFQCNCGNYGCLETIASATGIKQLWSIHGNGSPCSVKDIAVSKDKYSMKVMNEVYFYLGVALSVISVFSNPKRIIIGGGVSAAPNLVEGIKKYYSTYTFTPAQKDTQIVVATLGNYAGVYGAARLAQQHLI